MSKKYMSSKNLEKHILRYKTIYSTSALILGSIALMSGSWLGSLGYQPEVTGWMLNIFGCTILSNDNNLAPGLFLFSVGLFFIVIGIRTNRKPKGQIAIDRQALLYKFIYSMAGLIAGFLSSNFGIVLAENGGNLCPTDWATKIVSYENMFSAGAIFFLVGIIMTITTRYRIRVSNRLEEGDTDRFQNRLS